jgi:hypothetical protein
MWPYRRLTPHHGRVGGVPTLESMALLTIPETNKHNEARAGTIHTRLEAGVGPTAFEQRLQMQSYEDAG